MNPPSAAAAFMDGPLTPATPWETVAATRWGLYTTEVVQDLVSAGCTLAGTPGAALEVGCEGGRWTRMLARDGWSMTCTDVDARSLQICQDRVPSARCVLVAPDATRLPCETGTLRMLLCLEVFSVMDSEWFASEASRVLDDQGVLVGVTLNRWSARGAFVRLKEYLRGESRFYNTSYAEWRRRIEDGGFDIVLQRGYLLVSVQPCQQFAAGACVRVARTTARIEPAAIAESVGGVRGAQANALRPLTIGGFSRARSSVSPSVHTASAC